MAFTKAFLKSDDYYESLAERIYMMLCNAKNNRMPLKEIAEECLTVSTEDVGKSLNMLIARDIVGWESVHTYGDTIYLRG